MGEDPRPRQVRRPLPPAAQAHIWRLGLEEYRRAAIPGSAGNGDTSVPEARTQEPQQTPEGDSTVSSR